MIFIVGNTYKTEPAEDHAGKVEYCANCGYYGEMQFQYMRSWFTFFFIPLFPVGKKHLVKQCHRCGHQYDGPPFA